MLLDLLSLLNEIDLARLSMLLVAGAMAVALVALYTVIVALRRR